MNNKLKEFDYKDTSYKSYSMIKLFAKSPELYHYRYILGNDMETTDAMAFGSAFHTYVLEFSKFNKEYFTDVDAPDCGRTAKKYKEYFLELSSKNEGKTFLKRESYKIIQDMSDVLHNDSYISSLLLDFEENEKSIHATIDKRNFKGTPDKYNIQKRIVLDLKTCVDCTLFEKDANNFQYFIQQAMYKNILNKIYGKKFEFIFIAIQKKPPYFFDTYSFTSVDDEVATNFIEDTYDRIIECEKDNSFIFNKTPKEITILPWGLK